jgi:hypothetical protein
MLRWSDELIEAAVLGDCTVVVQDVDGAIETLSDDRLQSVAAHLRRLYRQRLAEGSGLGSEHKDLLAQIRSQEKVARNSEGGYWIAEAEPAAAEYARVASWERSAVRAFALATDGAINGFDRAGVPLIDIMSNEDIDSLLSRAHQAEEADPDAIRFPRSKRHDDKALAVGLRD